jgi:hypothetical protein
LSLFIVERILKTAGLSIWDVEELPTHGGSLRVYGCHAEDPRSISPTIGSLLAEEARRGLQSPAAYRGLQARADKIKDDLLFFLLEQKHAGKKVAGYGAAAKGNTLLNYAGIKPDLIPFVCDAADAKQGRFMPGSHIPILPPAILCQERPDYVVIFPWNIVGEIKQQNDRLAKRGTKFVTAVPKLEVV